MSASIDKKIQVLFYLILRSAPKQVVQAQRAAWCKTRRIHDSRHKKRHRDFSKEVDSFNSGTGKFTCISGASAPKQVVQAQRAARCKPRRIHDSRHKKRHRIAMSFLWWEEVDSNHRRRCQQIYSLLPLATRESSHAWSWWSESNQQPADYKSAALPLSHTSEVFGTKTLCRTIRIKMVPWGGVEPPTQGFSVPCSTN